MQRVAGPLKGMRMILPDPAGPTVKQWSARIPGVTDLASDIESVTKEAIGKGIEVRWYPFFAGTSWWIANKQREDAFFHVEIVAPYSGRDDRQSYRVQKRQDKAAFDRMVDIFETMWKESKLP